MGLISWRGFNLEEYSAFCVQRAAMLDYNTDYQNSYPFELLQTVL